MEVPPSVEEATTRVKEKKDSSELMTILYISHVGK